MKWLSLLLLCTILLLASCTPEFPAKDPAIHYTFDLSAEQEPTIIPHNAILALTFDKNKKTLSSTSGSNLITVSQTKIGCWGDRTLEAYHPFWKEELTGQLYLKDSIPASQITLSLPYRSLGSLIDKPGTLCVGTYSPESGWKWNYTPITPLLDDAAQQGSAEIELDGSQVAAVAILFDATTLVEKVTIVDLK